ncbi:LOW QUALITY PROTEIN: IQ domain-containing protein H [Notechis scutatus]|uniref:LOW QUALITY PROTEIN: IQ domain-containing protein H n=1 Tax=Notechis scutatus TaxID=8663 RepID=A0A6J1UM13_9SAUR|nr:LOW QUALITY PROTEIN: IQ domain-containing protein H [Notechis scutatus]
MAGVAGSGVELGSVLVQVQEDLQQLKEQLRDFSHDWETTNAESLESIVEKAENRLRDHAEKYLNAVNRSVLTIFPADDVERSSRQISKWGIPLEPSQKAITFPKMPVITPPGAAALPPASSLGSKHKLSMMMKILCDPRHIYHRSIVNQNYGVSLPLVNRRKTACAPTQKIAKGVTVYNLPIAPSSSYLSHIHSALPITEKDGEKGILNLIERGLIPRAARITLKKPPILPKPVLLHEFQAKHKKVDAGFVWTHMASPEGWLMHSCQARWQENRPGLSSTWLLGWANDTSEEFEHPALFKAPFICAVDRARQSKKVEAAPLPSQKATQVSEGPAEGGKEKKGTKGSIAPPPSCISVMSSKKLKQQQLLQAMRLRESAASSACMAKPPEEVPPETFKKVAFEFEIPVCKGVLDYAAPDLVQFKQYCCLFWGSVFSFLQQVEALMKDYAVPLAIVLGKRAMDLVPHFELSQRATREEILSVLKNVSTVQKLLKQPGRRYKGENGTQKAATKIQATWRCYKLRKSYIGFRHRQWASGIIAISWLIHVHLKRVRKTLKESRQKHLENFRLRSTHLAANWNRIRSSRRTIIHIPSLGRGTLLSLGLSATPITHRIMTP